jgi:hypothetical protein
VAAISDLRTLLESINPTLHPRRVAFCVAADASAIPTDGVVATMREAEGVTVVLFEADAERAGLQPVFVAEWLTLNVHSDLSAVGLTAAIATALAAADLSCNVIAGVHHDHIFVPHGAGPRALAVLEHLSARARSGREPL